NRKIKQIQRTAYGYRNFEHLKARIYLQTYLLVKIQEAL
ncbi:transposase, partial [Ligilactobacillus murinus]